MPEDSASRPARGVYAISVVAELTGLDPQIPRLYEQRGLLTPARTEAGTRRYSDDDLARLERIIHLVEAGINIAGIAYILNLQDRNTQLESDNNELHPENTRLRTQESDTDR